MTCPHDCFCNVEGARGIITDGIGTPIDPFAPQPDTGRTIPGTWAAVGSSGLHPAAGAADQGMLAWNQAEQLELVFDEQGNWIPLGPNWTQALPTDLALTGIAGAWQAAGKSIFLSPASTTKSGAWFVKANGYFNGSADPLAPPFFDGSVPSSQSFNTFDLTARLFDVTNSRTLDETRTELTLWAFSDSAGYVVNFGIDLFSRPFDLQEIYMVGGSSAVEVQLQFKRSEGGGDVSPGTYFARSLDLAAIELAPQNKTVA